MEEKKTARLWHIVFAVSSTALVIASLVHWLYTDTALVSSKTAENSERVETLQARIEALKSENSELKNRPPKIKEVVKEKVVELPCEESATGEALSSVSPQPCPPCPEPEPCEPKEDTAMNAPAASKPPQLSGATRLVSVDSIVCTKMKVGEWQMPASCQKALDSFVRQGLDASTEFLVLTPLVDTKRYKGFQPELKQAGLGQFRIERAKREIKTLIGPKVHIFSKKAMQKPQMRGFVLERYRVEPAG